MEQGLPFIASALGKNDDRYKLIRCYEESIFGKNFGCGRNVTLSLKKTIYGGGTA